MASVGLELGSAAGLPSALERALAAGFDFVAAPLLDARRRAPALSDRALPTAAWASGRWGHAA